MGDSPVIGWTPKISCARMLRSALGGAHGGSLPVVNSSPSTSASGASSSSAPAGPENNTYAVQPGDTLNKIARDHAITVQQLLAANPELGDPNALAVGQQLNLPSGAAANTTPVGGAAPVDAVDTGTPGGLFGGNDVTGASAPPPPSTGRPELARGASGPQVSELQQLLTDAGARPGTVDGDFGGGTERGVKTFQAAMGLPITGVADAATWGALERGDRIVAQAADGAPNVSSVTPYGRYEPGSDAAKALFASAAQAAGVPASWADSDALHTLLAKESQGRVAVPNYTYGSRKSLPSTWAGVRAELIAGIERARSSATGLGQMKLFNVDAHYPDGREGIGNPHNEAVGMLRYIEDRYGSPEAALQFHQRNGWY